MPRDQLDAPGTMPVPSPEKLLARDAPLSEPMARIRVAQYVLEKVQYRYHGVNQWLQKPRFWFESGRNVAKI
jgi:hypothetical protein